MDIERDSMEFDVLVVGGGPAGLAAAIRLKQLAAKAGSDISVCVIEKGSEIGAHTLSGAVMDPRAITELMPDWKAQGAPLETEVTEDEVLFLTATKSYRTPNWALPSGLRNHKSPEGCKVLNGVPKPASHAAGRRSRGWADGAKAKLHWRQPGVTRSPTVSVVQQSMRS